MKDIKDMNQFERARLENMVARALHTQRRLITIDKATPLSDGNADLRVIFRGGFVYRLHGRFERFGSRPRGLQGVRR